MPFLSDESHKRLYYEPENLITELSDVMTAVNAILELDINDSLKKRLVKDCVWEVTRIRGDFRGRFRSEGVMVSGNKIQRDHVWQKARIIERILKKEEILNNIFDDIQHCVVTETEHKSLTAASKSDRLLDGWSRYRAAGIVVLDMQSNQLHPT